MQEYDITEFMKLQDTVRKLHEELTDKLLEAFIKCLNKTELAEFAVRDAYDLDDQIYRRVTRMKELINIASN